MKKLLVIISLLLLGNNVLAADFTLQLSPATSIVQQIVNDNHIGLHATLTSSTAAATGSRDVVFDSASSELRREYDTSSFYNPSTGVITIPENGRYAFYVQVRLTGTKSSGATKELLLTDVSNNVVKQLDENPWVSTNLALMLKGSVEIKAVQGEQFKIRLGVSADSLAITGDSAGSMSYLSVKKIGN